MNTDPELIAATLSGDKSAFGKLVSRYQKKAHQLACRIISNPTDASDIVQETFVKAYQNIWQL
jgi:RNA polymerase sigma-70 factor (ECF subfamily)